MDDQFRLLRTREAAECLSVSTRTLRRYLAAGILTAHRLPSGQLRFREGALEALLSSDGCQRATQELGAPGQTTARAKDPKVVLRARRRDSGAPLNFDTSPEALAALREANCS
jgi:excisionase family DNA binding protein